MMRSLFSGVSGIRVHQTKMDVIGNNIANVNTVGYKSSRVTFSEVFSQNIGGASGANPASNRGGVNPMQIGLGANVASIDKLMTTGASQRTDNPFDLMIQGDGFFIVGDASGTYFTRAGALNLDAEGNLVTSGGLKVMGWEADAEGKTVTRGVVEPIEITGEKQYITPKPTTEISFDGNLNAESNTSTPKVTSMTFYDSVGNRYVVDVEMQYDKSLGWRTDPADPDTTEGAWDVRIIGVAYPNGDRTNGVTISVEDGMISFLDVTPVPNPPTKQSIGTLNFNNNGLPEVFIPAGASAEKDGTTGVITIDPGTDTTPTGESNSVGLNSFILRVDPNSPNLLIPSADFGDTLTPNSLETDTPVAAAPIENGIIIDFSKLTQFGNLNSNATSTPVNGNAPGNLNGLSIGSDGTIMGRYSNGQTKLLAQIPVAVFKNPGGLEKVGNNLFATTPNSGNFDGVGEEITTSGGSMLGGVLEMSNVDLSSEFVELITTQRGFQANSRVITTSDELLQELVNLKR